MVKKLLHLAALALLMAVPWTAQAQFCTPNPTSKDGSGITNVSFGMGTEVVNSAVTWASSPYYINNSSQIGAVPASLDAEINITFATGYTYSYIIWVDWNGDSVFNGTEVVAVGSAPSTNPVTITATFSIASSQDTGTYLMRICAADSYFDSYVSSISSASTANPCDTYTWGVALDYTLHVIEAPSCIRPENLTATDITSDGLTLSWTDTENNSASYSIDYWKIGGDTNTVTSTTTSYTFTGLDANTVYYFSVKAVCSAGEESLPIMGNWKTDCEGGSCSVKFAMVDDYGDGWNGNAIGIVSGGLELASFTIASGDSANDSIQVCSGSPVSLVFHRGSYPDEMSGSVLDGSGATVFAIENMDNRSDGDTLITFNPCPTCYVPSGLAASVNEDGETVFTWTSNASQFIVLVGDSIYSENVTDTSYTFTDLEVSTAYRLGVAAICEIGDTSGIVYLNYRTPCGAIATLPWTAGFETDDPNVAPACWTVLDSVESAYYGSTPKVYSSPYYAHTGDQSLYMMASYAEDVCRIISSPIVADPGNLHVQFWAYLSLGYGGVFDAGIMTNPNDPTSFQVLKSINSSSSDYLESEWSMYEFFTDTLGLEEGDTAWLAFRFVGGTGSYYYGNAAYLDDISLKTIPNCRMPISGSGVIDSISYESAHFAWDGTSENGYDLMLIHYIYGELGVVIDSVIEHFSTDSNSRSVNTLIPNTNYYAYAATTCLIDGEADTTDYLFLGTFQTQMRCYPVYQADLTAITSNAAVISWHYLPGMGIAGSGAVVTLTDLSDASVAPQTQTVLDDSTITFSNLVSGHSYNVAISSLCGAADTAAVQNLYFTPHTPECAQAFTEAQVGTYTSSNVPMASGNNYWFSQALYNDSILNGLTTLSGVAYNARYDYNLGVNNFVVDMYMGYIDTNLLAAYGGDYYLNHSFPVDSAMVKVVDDYHFSVTGNNWYYIPFDTVFNATTSNGAKRLVVTTIGKTESRENGNNYWSVKYEYTYSSVDYTSYYKSRYYTSYDSIQTQPNGYGSSYIPNIRFFGDCEHDCMAPSASLTGSTGTTVSLQWLGNGDETSWNVQYRSDSDTGWTTAASAVTANSYTITGLVSGAQYRVRVGAICSDTVVYCTPLSAFTSCTAIVPPYSVTLTVANPCWSSNNSPSSTNGYNIYSNYYLISPEMGVSIDTLMLRITDRCYGESATNQHYYVFACDADGSNRVPIDTVTATEGSNFGVHELFLMGYTGTQTHFGIASANSGDVYIKAVEIDYLPACTPVSSVALTAATLNSLTLSWNSQNTAATYTANYRLAGTTAWSTLAATATGVTISGLAASSSYEVQIVTNCSDGTTMSTAVFQFSTECAVEDVPYRQEFFYERPSCWVTFNTGHPNYTWAQSVPNTNGYIYSESASSNTAANDWLMTPPIAIPASAATDSIKVIYYIAGVPSYSTNSIARYELRVAPNGGSTVADFTDTLTIDTLTSSSFEYRSFSLASYAGDTIRFAFRNTSVYDGLIGMYDFGVRDERTPVYYMSGSNFVYVNDTNRYVAAYELGDSATSFAWTSTMVTAGHAVMLNGTTDTMSIIYSADGYDTLTLVVANPYGTDTLKGVVHVFDLNPVTTFPYTTGFETTNADNNSWILRNGINAWMVGTDVNNGGAGALYISNDGTTNSYTNNTTAVSYASRAFEITVPANYSINFDWLADGESNYDYIRAFWVPDSNFHPEANVLPDGTTSLYSFTTATVAGWTSLGGKLNQASGWMHQADTLNIATPGRYHLVFMWGNDGSSGSNPPAAIDNVVVNNDAAPFVCADPVITASAATETTASFSWSGEADTYQVAIAAEWDSATVTPVSVTDTFYSFANLTAGTEYTLGVRAVCDAEHTSQWMTVTVTTDEHPCYTPTALTYENVTLNSATLGWTPGEAETADGPDVVHDL